MKSQVLDKRIDWLVAIIIYITVLIYQGYQYGQGDQAQILPVLYAQDHPDVFAQDHYVQSYLESEVNERTVFHAWLRHLGYAQPWIVFFWHAVFSLLLIVAWMRIAALFQKEKIYQWLSVITILLIGYHTSVGSNELYYNFLIPSLVAKAMASWAIWYWLKEKYFVWSVLLVLATYVQPLVGIQCFLFTVLGSLAVIAFQIKNDVIPWKPILVFLVCTVPWIFLLGKYNGGHQQPVEFMEIMEFRLSHHFFPSSFGVFHFLMFSVFIILSLAYYKRKIKWVVITIVLGCVMYAIGVEALRSPIVLYSQWWKTTIWVEAFGLVALFGLFEKHVYKWRWRNYQILVPVIILLLVWIYRFSGIAIQSSSFDAPISHSHSDAIDIAEASYRQTPQDAVFIIPPELTAFRWYAKRDTYVDYKAMLHQESFLHTWYKRMEEVYGYTWEDKRNGITVYDAARKVLSDPDPQTISRWKSLGVTHMIGYPPGNSSMILLEENETYLLYKVP